MAGYIHLTAKEIKCSVELLSVLLASTYALYLKTQRFHWNVRGATFSMLHEFFGEQYVGLAEAIDEIAERIRMLGEDAPGSFSEFAKLSLVKDSKTNGDHNAMVKELLADHHTVIKQLRAAIIKLSEGNDQGTLDFMIGRLRDHEKSAWMLDSHQ